MTDRFEDAVREAARGLGDGSSADLPTYHDAWQRGRRRRLRKQAGLTFAGAVMTLGALVGLTRIATPGQVEMDDLALDVAAATSVVEVATTDPILATDEPSDLAPAPSAIPLPAQQDDNGETSAATAPGAGPSTEAVVAPTPTATAQPATATPEAQVAETQPVPPVATETPLPTPPPTLAPVPTPTPTVAVEITTTGPAPDEQSTADPNADDSSTTGPVPDDQDPTDGTEDGDPDDSTLGDSDSPDTSLAPDTATTTTTPGTTFAPGQEPDATILEVGPPGGLVACDRDGDARADASCRLLPDYACTGTGDIQPGYMALDLDGDGQLESCVASGTTACDSTGDGLADTPCIIELENSAADG